MNKDDIPNSVTHLTFGYNFNQPLKKDDIPNLVTHLTFDYDFNQPLKKGDIPESVTHLFFNELFNQPLDDNNLPKNIIEVWFFGKMPYSLSIPKNIFLGNIIYNEYNNHTYYYYNDNLIIWDLDKNLFDKKISVFTSEKYIGNIILQELTQKVFHPNRLLKICDKYNIGFDELIEIY